MGVGVLVGGFHPSYFVTQSCLSLCDAMDSPPGTSIHGVSQAGILEWDAISFSRGYSEIGIEPAAPALASGFFTA